MVAGDFLQDPQVRRWLDGIEPAWTLLNFDSLRALRQEPSAGQTAIRIANDLSVDEIAGSAVARNTLILLRQATERGGLPVTATGNLSRAVGGSALRCLGLPVTEGAVAQQFVAYYRVSTDRQGRSGLGWEAQQAAVRGYLGASAPIAEFIEIESGERNDRPQL